MARTGERRRQAASRPSWSRRTRPASPSARRRRRWAGTRSPRARCIFEDVRVPVANRSARRAGLQDRHGGARRRAHQHRRLLARRRAGGARQGPRLRGRAQGVRPPHRRLPGAAVQARRHGDRAGGGAHVPVARGRGARRQGDPTRPSSAPWPSASPPTPASRSPTRRCSCTAATATSPTTAREDRARPARAPDPRRHQRDHAGDRGARPDRAGQPVASEPGVLGTDRLKRRGRP